jgi:hypothetical protein
MDRRQFLKFLSALCTIQSVPLLTFGRNFNSGSLSRPTETSQTGAIKTGFQHQDSNLEPICIKLLESIVKRLSRLQDTVGYGNFCLVNFDEMRSIAESYASIGGFPPVEIDCLEMLFYTAADRYGFHGQKTFHSITDRIDKNLTEKIPGTGNYLYKGKSIATYQKLTRDVGKQLILTAGVRGIVKQFYLFLSKALRHDSSLTSASRSIAPPGYSFHATGDFDVGKIGFGVANFTGRFTQTDVYARLKSLDYVTFRYPQGNPTGIVFEPWHIQVV